MMKKHIPVRKSMLAKVAKFVPDYNGVPVKIEETEDGKVIATFDSMPALLFVSYDGNGTYDEFFVKGERSLDHRTLAIQSEPGAMTTYSREQYAALDCIEDEPAE